MLGLTPAGGLEGPGTLWVTLHESSIPQVVGGFAAHHLRKKDTCGEGCTFSTRLCESPKMFSLCPGQIHSARWGVGAAKPPPQKSWLWCGAAKPRRTTTNVQHVLA